LKGRAVFLTGGGTGLWPSMALRFAGLGARIFSLAGAKIRCGKHAKRSTGPAALRIHHLPTCATMAAVEAAAARPKNNSAKQARWSTTPPAISWRAPKTDSQRPSNAVVGIVLNGSFHARRSLQALDFAKLGGKRAEYRDQYTAANCGSGLWCRPAVREGRRSAMTTSLAVEWSKYHIR